MLRALFIDDWQREAYHQQQNKAENRYQTAKRLTNVVLNRTGAPACCWLLCMMCIFFVLNHAFNFTINNVPLHAATGSTCDISPLLRFSFYQPVHYKQNDSDFPSDTTEDYGRFVGTSENVGHAMTFKILTSDTNKVLYRSNVRPADDHTSINLRDEPLAMPKIVKSLADDVDDSNFEEPSLIDEENAHTSPQPKHRKHIPIIDPSDLVGRYFLQTEEDRQRLRVKIAKAIETYEDELNKNSARRELI